MRLYVLTSVNAGVLADGSSTEWVDAVLWTGALFRSREGATVAAQAWAREAFEEVGDLRWEPEADCPDAWRAYCEAIDTHFLVRKVEVSE